jgi:hypothetical protein
MLMDMSATIQNPKALLLLLVGNEHEKLVDEKFYDVEPLQGKTYSFTHPRRVNL